MAVIFRVLVSLSVIFQLFLVITQFSVKCDSLEVNSERSRFRRQSLSYHQRLESNTFSEDSDLETILFDFNSVNIDGQAASSFSYEIQDKTGDSVPSYSSYAFQITPERKVTFNDSVTEETRKYYFDYEKYSSVVIVIEAVHTSDTKEEDVKLIKLTIPLSDVNDELPVLENKPFPYLAAVPVNPNAGDTVYELLAEDPDENADIVYYIDESKATDVVKTSFQMNLVTEGSGENQVVIGHIKVSTRAAFSLGDKFTIPVKIEDKNGVYPQSITADVQVLVGPRPPQFYENVYKGSIFETDTLNNPVYTGEDSSKELVVKVRSFQGKLPKTFRIVEDNNKDSKHFRIDENGRIFNKDSLDYDIEPTQRPPVFQLFILVTETLEDGNDVTNTVSLEIEVKDENDNPPRFKLTQYLETISESRPVGATILTVMAEDNDSGKNAEVTYKLEDEYFGINRLENDVNGYIIVKKKLDFDQPPGPIYRFSVHVSDSGVPSLSSSVDVTITTTNVNDENPTLQSQSNLVLRDGVDVSKQPYFLTRLRAQDADGDGIQFYLKSADGKKVQQKDIFRIIPSSGVLEVSRPVPQDKDSYTLEVIAEDDGKCCGGSKRLNDTMSFLVEIVDSLNQKPTFDDCLQYTERAAVNEESDPGTPVITVEATDDGRGLNGIVRYSIISPNPDLSNAPFTIDRTTGAITVKSTIDRETTGANFIQVTVKATDQGEFPQDSWCTFRVKIIDVNDNKPVFNIDYTQAISSKTAVGKVLLRVAASDKDIGKNAELVYTLENDGDGVFGIYNETGLIYLKKNFKGGILKYTLMAKAQDKGNPPLSVTVPVVLRVTSEETTLPPEFQDGQRTFTVSETVPTNYKIADLTCSSNNEDLRVQFFLASEDGELLAQRSGKFAIETSLNNNLNQVTLSVAKPLDYEVQKKHIVSLRCQNFAAIPMYEEIELTIIVQDMNDEAPSFPGWIENGRYAAGVHENKPEQTIVTSIIQADDPDISSKFNQVTYKISSDSYVGVDNDFEIRTIDGNKGEVVTKREFDREMEDRYILIIIAEDMVASDVKDHSPPGTPNSATVALVISIDDENDNKMVFKQDLYEHTVKETANIGFVIFAVTADDPDEVDQGKLLYNFANNNIPFDIRDRTGEIFVTGNLDYESPQKEYLLTLESRDSLNKYSASTMVKITLTDENDNTPIFDQKEYKVQDVTEEDTTVTRENPKPLVQVKASDKDISRTKQIRYQLLGDGTQPGPSQLFKINETSGQIYLQATLDRDKPRGKAEYIFTVEALDEDINPLKGYANVKVFPIDINDNKPVFDRSSLMDTIPEHTKEGSFVAQVKATDVDAGINAELSYDIVKSPATTDDSKTNFFRIKPNGEIYSQVDGRYLDRETMPQLEVHVKATDKGIPSMSASAVLTIKLSDINDNAPQFVQKNYEVSFSESRESGVILEVQATDADIDENALLTFSIENSNEYFKIDPINNKGYISIIKPVDYEQADQKNFLLNIVVKDKDQTHRDTAKVNITVEDFNDEPPVFLDAFQRVEIKEGDGSNSNISTFTAQDKDSGIRGELSYAIDRKSDPRREFYIEPNTGVVGTRKSLDREIADKMEVIILAIDKGDPQLTGTATMEVIIKDINDNFPIFKEDYRPVVMENGGPSDLPLEIFAIDLDTPQFGPPFEFALPDNCAACSKFSLDFNPGGDSGDGTATIRITDPNMKFDREEQKYYELPIVMSDMRDKTTGTAQTGTNTLTITIGDQNDNPHKPGHQDVFVYNYKGSFGPLVIGRVYVEDKDDWDLPDKNFTFLSPASLRSYFEVDLGTGDIMMKKGVKANADGQPYKFSVTVYDGVFKSSVVSTVAVTVQDLTEEAVANSGGVRFNGITASEFILEPIVSGQKEDSKYTKFRKLLANKLGYSLTNVEIINLRDGDGYLEVRYSAHASPYLSSAEMDNIVIMNQEEFEALGLEVGEIPIDECQDEIFEGGCYNKLTITGNPVTVNANGTSYVGVEAYMVATQGCEADVFPPSNECAGDYCHNGGQCYKDDWGSLKCRNCPAGYTGARCQERRHSFDGNSVATYKTLTQCEESQTSIEFITQKEDGVIFYNGPLRNVDPQSEKPVDFIILQLVGGYPVLHIDQGTGVAVLSLDGKDNRGQQLLQKLNDGVWHHIDINRKGKEVELVVDRCDVAEVTVQIVEDDRACRVKKQTPGVNMYLNVNTLLQLGGVRLLEAGVSHLRDITLQGFDGCLRNFIHNKQLYDLHYKEISGVNTGKNGCPREDVFCNPPGSPPKCGLNGDCEATLSGDTKCTCHSGYWGQTCDKEATVWDYKEDSYFLWEMKNNFFGRLIRNRQISAHIMFRTRQRDGALMVLEDTSASTTQHIKLMLYQGILRLTYNLGDGEKILDMVNAVPNNGEWHSVTMERYGTEFHLKMDNGEGRNYAYRLASQSPRERSVFRVNKKVYSGGYLQSSDDLVSSCVQDVRINHGYFAMTAQEGEDADSVAVVDENPNTDEGCSRDDCLGNKCSTLPNTYCFPLWEDFECRCKPGYHGQKCLPMCAPNPCFNNVTCVMLSDGFKCQCPSRWRGQLCDELGPEEVVSADMSDTALIAIIVCIILVILIALIVFLIYFKLCKNGDDGEKYILEVDPEDDIRENVMNYDEEGAGEKDQDVYDISRLQPNNETFNRPYDVDVKRNVPLRNAPGEKPDVGNFIDDRMQDADNDDGAPPHDSVREFNFEGGDSDAGSLSSLNTSSSDQSQDYDYLNDWGPKFSKLADMYGAGQDLPSS